MLKNNYSRERTIKQTNKQKPKIKPREVNKTKQNKTKPSHKHPIVRQKYIKEIKSVILKKFSKA